MHHDASMTYLLVFFSILVSVLSAYTAYDLIVRIEASPASARSHALRALASVVLGAGIWSMHFIGILSVHTDGEISYRLPYLFASAVLPIAASYLALALVSRFKHRLVRSAQGGLLVGLAIIAMHYTGMRSIVGYLTYAGWAIWASAAIALILSCAAFHLLFVHRDPGTQSVSVRNKTIGGALLGAATPGMHYMAMAGTTIVPFGGAKRGVVDGISATNLASFVGAATLFIVACVWASLLLDRQQAMRHARFNERRYFTLFEHSPDMVACYDPYLDQLISVNPAVQRNTGYSEADLPQLRFDELIFDEEEFAMVETCLMEVIHGTAARQAEFHIAHKNGSPMLISATIFPLFVDKRRYVYFVARDITDKRRAELELVRAKEAAESADRVKSRFLATMSHEIRTPLNGIVGINELLQHTSPTEDQLELLRLQRKSSEALLSVIQDVLDFSRFEAGSVGLVEEPFDPMLCLRECLDLFSVSAREKGLWLELSASPDLPGTVVGDQSRLRQILINLIGNAVKFTDAGYVRLEAGPETAGSAEAAASRDGADGGRKFFRFAVTDTGIGIDPAQAESVFLPFHQIDSATDRKYGGTGLGLSICRKLAEAMGGAIWLDTGRGTGARFVFRLPFGTVGQQRN